MQGLLTGGAGAVVGAVTSNSGNMAVDVVNSTTSAMAQSRPEVKDPDVVSAEAAQDPIRKQNYANALKQAQNDYKQYAKDNPLLNSSINNIGSNTSLPSGMKNSSDNKSTSSIIKVPGVTPKEVISPVGDSPLQSIVKKPEIIQGQNLGGGL